MRLATLNRICVFSAAGIHSQRSRTRLATLNGFRFRLKKTFECSRARLAMIGPRDGEGGGFAPIILH